MKLGGDVIVVCVLNEVVVVKLFKVLGGDIYIDSIMGCVLVEVEKLVEKVGDSFVLVEWVLMVFVMVKFVVKIVFEVGKVIL